MRDIKHAITDGIKMAKGAIDSSLAHNTTALDKVLNSNNVSLAKSLTQMHSDAQFALKANIAQGKASLDAAIESSRLDQRAWVGQTTVAQAEYTTADGKRVFLKEGERPRFTVTVVNSGKTIAKNVKNKIAFITLLANQPFVPEYPSMDWRGGNAVYQPGMQAFLSTPRASSMVRRSDLDKYMSGTHRLYLYGIVTYDDAFGMPHFTTFCMFLGRELTSFFSCETYNDAN